jgi:hypothetical protein
MFGGVKPAIFRVKSHRVDGPLDNNLARFQKRIRVNKDDIVVGLVTDIIFMALVIDRNPLCLPYDHGPQGCSVGQINQLKGFCAAMGSKNSMGRMIDLHKIKSGGFACQL